MEPLRTIMGRAYGKRSSGDATGTPSRADDLEERLLDHMRQIETNLLTAFHSYAKGQMPAYIPSKQPIRSCGSEWTLGRPGLDARDTPAVITPAAFPLRSDPPLSLLRYAHRQSGSARAAKPARSSNNSR